jgi:hypothetical protein
VARVVVALVVILAVVSVTAAVLSRGSSTLSPLRSRIVSIAEGQVGYQTNPPNTYCNKYSAYWGSGTSCGNGLSAEEWCADFAAWVWQQAGAQVTYQFTPGDLNSAAASFYVWAVDHGTWHAANSGYIPQPGDVAVYGLNTTTVVAQHVAIVSGYESGNRGPDVVNGDGSHSAFSIVEMGQDQTQADVHGTSGALAGYASPLAPPPPSPTTSS